MCSNNTSSGSYGDLQQDEYSGSCLKKQKKVKVRRRGPGVAELEKIRLQEEHKSPLSSSPSLPNMDHHTLFAPVTTMSYGYDLVMIPPNFALPEKLPPSQVFPFSYGYLIPPAPVFQRKQHSLTMNLPNPQSPGAGGFYQFIEPPSNQRSCVDPVSHFLEEENKKTVNAKRPRHFLTDTTKPNIGPSTTTIIRDAIQNRSLGISTVQDSGTTISNPITIDSPTSIPSFPRHYPRFIPLGLQHEQQQQKDFDENVQWRNKKPFYSFISSDDRSNGDREKRPCDQFESATDHGIDLSLKL